jgi:hypothetical protein
MTDTMSFLALKATYSALEDRIQLVIWKINRFVGHQTLVTMLEDELTAMNEALTEIDKLMLAHPDCE